MANKNTKIGASVHISQLDDETRKAYLSNSYPK